MSLRALAAEWNAAFFFPRSPTPLALFRIIHGLIIVATLLLLRPDWLAWFGPHAWITLTAMHAVEPGIRLNVFTLLPQTDLWIDAFFWFFLGSALLLTVGLWTRLNAAVVFLCLTSMDQRNLYITHGGDTFLRVSGFFLMFAPAGAALSIDRLIGIWKGREGADVRPRAPWAQRMIQFELALVYFVSFWWKSMGSPWVDGVALYFVSHLAEVQRFPIPSWLQNPVLLKAGSWGTLALEFALGVLIWFRELRYPLLALGLALHLTLEYALNLPMVQWDFLSGYVLFIYPEDLHSAWAWVRDRFSQRLGEPVEIIYDSSSVRSLRSMTLLSVFDVFGRVRFNDARTANVDAKVNAPPDRPRVLGLMIAAPEGLRSLALVVPLLWPLAIPLAFLHLPRARENAGPPRT